MATKERNQNLVIGDTVELRIFVFNSNQYTNLKSIEAVKVYYLDPTAISDINPDGRTLFASLDVNTISLDDTGKYSIPLAITTPQFVIGDYIDQWSVIYDDTSNCPATIENNFTVYPNLWVVADKPLVYDFDFRFSPNRITKGSVKYVTVEIKPNVPKGTILEQYYENLAIVSDITITIVQRCGKCIPREEDLRTVVDSAAMTFKDRNTGYYLLDTTEMDCGIYDVSFTMVFGDTTQKSKRGPLEIFV
jgi:hypothetical protein